MNAERLESPCNLTETTLDESAERLGCRICDLHVYASRYNATEARRAQGVHGFELTIIPRELLKKDETWGASCHGRLIWSESF